MSEGPGHFRAGDEPMQVSEAWRTLPDFGTFLLRVEVFRVQGSGFRL